MCFLACAGRIRPLRWLGADRAATTVRSPAAKAERSLKRKIRETEKTVEDLDRKVAHRAAVAETRGRRYLCTPCEFAFDLDIEPVFCPLCGKRWREVGCQQFQ